MRYGNRWLMGALLAIGTLAIAGCGEKPQVIAYKQGHYQGKPDTQPWSGAEFKGDKQAWEKRIRERNLGQNEYARLAGS